MAVLPTPGSPMSTGLFFGRRDEDLHHALDLLRAADDRVELLLARELREVAAELVEHERAGRGVLALRRRRGRPPGRPSRTAAGTLVAGEQLDDLLAHAGEVGAELHEHLGGDALALADEAEEDVLGADVVVAELERLAQRQLEDLLGARREGDVAGRRRAALADDLLDLAAHGLERDAERLEGLGGDAFALVDEPEQDVLGADVVVVEEPSFLLRQHDDPSGPVGEAFEQGEPPAPIWGIRGSSVSLAPGIPPRVPVASVRSLSAAPCRQREPFGPFSRSRRPSPTVGRVAADSPLLQLPGMLGFRAQVDQALQDATAAEDELMAQMGGPPHHRRRQAGPAAVHGRLGGGRWRPTPTAIAELVTARRGARRRVGRARAARVAVPRRRHGRGRDPPRRRQRQRPLGQPQGDPRRRLPARQGVGDRRLARHRGRRAAGRAPSGGSARARSTSCATPTT